MKLKIGSNGCYLHDYLKNIREYRHIMVVPRGVAVAWVRVAFNDGDVCPDGNRDVRVLVDYGRWLNKMWVCVGHDQDEDEYTVIYNHDGKFYVYQLREREGP